MEQTKQHIIAFSFVCVCVCAGGEGGGGKTLLWGENLGAKLFFLLGGKHTLVSPLPPQVKPGTKLVTNDFQLFIQNKCNYLFTVLGPEMLLSVVTAYFFKI